jgi:serine/threonine-protein phosphatase PGAM5
MLREKFPCDPQPPFSKKASLKSSRESEEAFAKYVHRPLREEQTTDVIVCHANVIRYFLCRALQIPPEAWLRFSLPHCSLTILTISGRGHVKVSAVGSAGHLPTNMQLFHNLPGDDVGG